MRAQQIREVLIYGITPCMIFLNITIKSFRIFTLAIDTSIK